MAISRLLQTTALNALRTSSVVTLGDTSYLMGTKTEWSLPEECDTAGHILPAVVLELQDHQLHKEGIQNKFKEYLRRDDVFHGGFTERSVLILRSEQLEPTPTLSASLTEHLNVTSSKLLFISTTSSALPDGPYFLHGTSLHRAWKLYPDTNSAFTLAVIPSESGSAYDFEPLHAGAYSGLHRVVAVPSRLYFEPSSEKPLNGLRVTVKDNYKLSGAAQTLGSRSYSKLYGSPTETAAVVRSLVDLGAVIVGKTKLGAFAGSEVPPEKCIDYFPPWNPRGDGYQGPSGSSSGAGSSVASYDWVDIGIGTDTTGSIRMPAASYGLWGLRSTWSSFRMDSIVPSVPRFDTVGLLARSPAHIWKVVEACASSQEKALAPTAIIYPTDWFPTSNSQQQQMVDMFLGVLANSLQIPVQTLSLATEWSRTAPEDLRGTSLSEYLDKSIYWPNYYDGYHSFDEFRRDHQEAFGYKPYTSPFMTRRWGLAENITKTQRDQGLEELQVYYQWVRDYVLSPDGENKIILLPLGRPGANYRDTVPKPGGEFSESAYDPIDFCTVLGLPQIVIPIGQNPYDSRVTDQTEYAPIVATLAGPRGSDLSLLKIAETALKEANWAVEVQTGRLSFPVGDNARHVAEPHEVLVNGDKEPDHTTKL